MKLFGQFPFSRYRYLAVVIILMIIAIVLLLRLVYLGETDQAFLLSKANQQAIRTITIPASRGAVLDRNGIPLAVSAPLDNVVFDPKLMLQNKQYWHELARSQELGLSYEQIASLVEQHPHSQFLYVKKGLPPNDGQAIAALKIPGVYIEQVFQTFFPSGPSAAQLVGFTDTNNQGQDGLELAYNKWLKATPGREQVLDNAIGQVLSVLNVIQPPQNGKDLVLSIDSRIQFVTYQALKEQVEATHADSGAAVVLDPSNGEVLAAASYPSFNPNDVQDRTGPGVRNRAITDTFEPGSVAKTFSIAAALESGQYTPTTPIDTRPGFYFFHGHKIRDDSDFGLIDVTGVLKYSSNVGVSKIALSLPHQQVYGMFVKAGFGQQPSGGRFPGEASGTLHPLSQMGDFEYATMTFGYDLSVSTLQLARAYAAVANGGILYPVSFVKHDYAPEGTRIMSQKTAQELTAMLKTVTETGNTGMLANVAGYTVVGKTGTSHIAAPHGYYKNKYNAVFAGFVPMEDPKLVIVVHINNPKGYYNSFGGVSAAPVFAKIAASSLSILGVPFTEQQIDQAIFKSQQRWLEIITKA
jgi:cell division protein FtsI (penicillin-binding protein 3)